MALLTAEDVLNKAFSKTKYREGFDQDEVDDFLDEVAHTISSLMAERDDFAARLQAAQSGQAVAPSQPAAGAQSGESSSGLLGAATDPNPSPTGMLAMAQKLHDEYVTSGEAEKERIIAEAKEKAEKIVEQAEGDAGARLEELGKDRTELERKIDDLRRFERDYRTRLTSYLENLLGDLDHGAGKDREPGDAPASSAGSAAAASSTSWTDATEDSGTHQDSDAHQDSGADDDHSGDSADGDHGSSEDASSDSDSYQSGDSDHSDDHEQSGDSDQSSDNSPAADTPWAPPQEQAPSSTEHEQAPEHGRSPYGAVNQPQDFASVFQDVVNPNEHSEPSVVQQSDEAAEPPRRRSPFDPVETDADDRPAPYGG